MRHLSIGNPVRSTIRVFFDKDVSDFQIKHRWSRIGVPIICFLFQGGLFIYYLGGVTFYTFQIFLAQLLI